MTRARAFVLLVLYSLMGIVSGGITIIEFVRDPETWSSLAIVSFLWLIATLICLVWLIGVIDREVK